VSAQHLRHTRSVSAKGFCAFESALFERHTGEVLAAEGFLVDSLVKVSRLEYFLPIYLNFITLRFITLHVTVR
jgi:hypothetical protein